VTCFINIIAEASRSWHRPTANPYGPVKSAPSRTLSSQGSRHARAHRAALKASTRNGSQTESRTWTPWWALITSRCQIGQGLVHLTHRIRPRNFTEWTRVVVARKIMASKRTLSQHVWFTLPNLLQVASTLERFLLGML